MKPQLLLGILFLLSSLSTEACLASTRKRNEVTIPQFCGQFTNESTLSTSDLSVIVHYFSYDGKSELKKEKASIDASGQYCIPAQLFKTPRGISTSLDLLSKDQILPVEGFRWQFSSSPVLQLHPYMVTTDNNPKGAGNVVRAYSHLILREFNENQQILKIKTLYDKKFADLAKDAQKRVYPGETQPLAWSIEISNTITVQDSYWAKPRFTFRTQLDQNPTERCGEVFPYPDGTAENLMSACIASSATEFKNDNVYSASIFSAKRAKTLLLSTDLTEDLLKAAVRETSSSIVFYRDGKIDQRVPMKFYLFEDFPDNCQYISNDDGSLLSGVRCVGALSELLGEQNYVLGIQ